MPRWSPRRRHILGEPGDALSAATGHAEPSLVNGSAVQSDEIGTRKLISAALLAVNGWMPCGVSSTNKAFSKWPTKPT
jgi:hypothetical protein